MWVFLNNAFLSIVAHRRRPDYLLVRARQRGDIQAVFKHPDVRVVATPKADYPFRAEIRRDLVGTVLRFAAQEIAYDNFKASVRDAGRHDAYLDVWVAMRRWQGGQAPVPKLQALDGLRGDPGGAAGHAVPVRPGRARRRQKGRLQRVRARAR